MPQIEVRVNYYRLVLAWILVIACTIGLSLLVPESNDRSIRRQPFSKPTTNP